MMVAVGTIEVRPATLEELAVAERLRASVFTEAALTSMQGVALQRQIRVRMEIRALVGEPPGHTLIAWDGDRAVGTVCIDVQEYSNPVPGLSGLWALRHLGLRGALRYLALAVASYRAMRPEEAYLHGMAVLPDYRRHGVAMLLMRAVEEKVLEIGRTKAVVFIAEDNVPSQKLAEKNGFRFVDRPRSWWRRLLFGRARYVCLEKVLHPPQ